MILTVEKQREFEFKSEIVSSKLPGTHSSSYTFVKDTSCASGRSMLVNDLRQVLNRFYLFAAAYESVTVVKDFGHSSDSVNRVSEQLSCRHEYLLFKSSVVFA